MWQGHSKKPVWSLGTFQLTFSLLCLASVALSSTDPIKAGEMLGTGAKTHLPENGALDMLQGSHHPYDRTPQLMHGPLQSDHHMPDLSAVNDVENQRQMKEMEDELRRLRLIPDQDGPELDHNLRRPPVFSSERPLPMKVEEEARKKFKESQNWKIPRLHSEKYDYRLMRGIKALGGGLKKGLYWVFRKIGNLFSALAYPFRTVVIENPKNDAEYIPEIPKVEEAVDAVWNSEKAPDIPAKLPFVKEDKLMTRSHEIGQRVQEHGFESVAKQLRVEVKKADQDWSFNLRLRQPYLEAQKNLFEAREKLLNSREELNKIYRQVLIIYGEDENALKDTMGQIFQKYVEYFWETQGSKKPALKSITGQEILDQFEPGIQHIVIGPLSLLAKDANFRERVITNRVLDRDEQLGQDLWAELEPHASALYEHYSKPAEDLVRWQNVIEKFETKLKTITKEQEFQTSKLAAEFDAIAKDESHDQGLVGT